MCPCVSAWLQQMREVLVSFEHSGGWSTETGGGPKVGATGTPHSPSAPLLATREDAAATGGGVRGQNENKLAQVTNAHKSAQVQTHTLSSPLSYTHTHTHTHTHTQTHTESV